MTAVLVTLVLTIVPLIGLIRLYKVSFKYWQNINVPFMEPSILFGSLKNVFLQVESIGQLVANSYHDANKSGHKHVGLFAFWRPIYVPVDRLIVQGILNTDFNNFLNKKLYFNEKDDPLSANLFFLEGERWRNLRAKLTPTFTGSKMKTMFPSFLECAKNLTNAMDEFSLTPSIPFDAGSISSSYTIDSIGCCAFGLECNSFKNPNSDFRKYGRMVFEISLWQSVVACFGFCSPELGKKLRLSFFNKKVTSFFSNLTKETIEYREKHNVKKNDFLQLLIDLKIDSRDLKDSNKVEQRLTLNEIAAQMFLFFVAGYETASTTMSFTLYELAANPEVQERARKETNAVLEANDGTMTYGSMASLKYLDQVLDETLRKYPPVIVLNRSGSADYTLPNTDIVLEKDVPIFISTLGLHYNPDYFPEPDKFDPERFSDENKSKILSSTYLPFGIGPRNCIGMRFAKLELKLALAFLLQQFNFTVNPKTKTPLELDPKSLMTAPLGGIWLNVNKV